MGLCLSAPVKHLVSCRVAFRSERVGERKEASCPRAFKERDFRLFSSYLPPSKMSITVLSSLPQLVGLTSDSQQISVIDFHAV